MEAVVMMPGHEVKELVESLKDAVVALNNKTRKSEKEFVSNDELMQLLGISKRTAQSWRDEGIIAFSQVGSKIYYSMADIGKLMQENRCGTYEELKRKGGKP